MDEWMNKIGNTFCPPFFSHYLKIAPILALPYNRLCIDQSLLQQRVAVFALSGIFTGKIQKWKSIGKLTREAQ